MSKNKKFFSLIRGDDVKVAPKTKRIPADEYSALLKGTELIDKVKEDADAYMVSIKEEGEKIKEQARQDGFEEGMQKWADQIKFLEEEIQKKQEEMTEIVIPVALKAAKKIIDRELKTSRDVIVDIVQKNLEAVTHHSVITIYVNPEDAKYLEKDREKLKGMFERLESLMIVERDDVESGGCIIETEGGIINAQLDNLWKVIEKAFNNMMKQEQKQGSKKKKQEAK